MRRGVVHWSTPEPTCSDRRSDPRNVRFRRFRALSVWTTPRRRGGPVDPAPGPGWSTPSRALDRISTGKKVWEECTKFLPVSKSFHLIISACRVQHLSVAVPIAHTQRCQFSSRIVPGRWLKTLENEPLIISIRSALRYRYHYRWSYTTLHSCSTRDCCACNFRMVRPRMAVSSTIQSRLARACDWARSNWMTSDVMA